ncbi:hypothetical protein [Paenibacillus silvisoli]|uniref:hypothetical protein n=1 Tax=Paenibacillus silvisoli TaxID=3110539 RepID=UPI002805D183|nr:hypothetical protein [Paenibacillus silvisoli]
MTTISPEVQSLVNHLHLPDHILADKFQFTHNGQKMTAESLRFLSFVKEKLLAAKV